MPNEDSCCPICNSRILNEKYYSDYDLYYYDCVNCGRFAISASQKDINKDMYAHFLFHHNRYLLPVSTIPYFYYLYEPVLFEKFFNDYPQSVLLKYEEIEAWYPKNISERIDYILTTLSKYSTIPGQEINISFENINNLFFIYRFSNGLLLDDHELTNQLFYINDYLQNQKLIEIKNGLIIILPEGWQRIAELQKNNSNNKQVFIAMSFSKEAKPIREKIKEGIINAGYFPFVMDEYEHNKQLVPEILYQIKQSKFVVAEFTINNNGAYYEAGFAAGLGKEVIHVCNEKAFKEQGHFDIKQKYAVFWENEDKIPDALQKRIEATIGRG